MTGCGGSGVVGGVTGCGGSGVVVGGVLAVGISHACVQVSKFLGGQIFWGSLGWRRCRKYSQADMM